MAVVVLPVPPLALLIAITLVINFLVFLILKYQLDFINKIRHNNSNCPGVGNLYNNKTAPPILFSGNLWACGGIGLRARQNLPRW